jgi:hypothetical protein
MVERGQHGVYSVSLFSRFVCSYEGKEFLLTHFLVTVNALLSQPCYNFCFYRIFWWNLVDLLGLKDILSSYLMTLRRTFLIELTNSRPSEWITFLLFFVDDMSKLTGYMYTSEFELLYVQEAVLRKLEVSLRLPSQKGPYCNFNCTWHPGQNWIAPSIRFQK